MVEKTVGLQQFSTQYSEHEDRIRISGDTEQGPIIIWLTQRLLQRLVPPLLHWIERQQAAVTRAVPFSFMQQTVQAHQQAMPQHPVAWLVQSIDITTTDRQVALVFKDNGQQAVQIVFSVATLQHWLELLHDAFLQAQWPLEMWPPRMTEPASVFRNARPTVWQ